MVHSASAISLALLSPCWRLSSNIPSRELLEGLEKKRSRRITTFEEVGRTSFSQVEREARLLQSPSIQGTFFDVLCFDDDGGGSDDNKGGGDHNNLAETAQAPV